MFKSKKTTIIFLVYLTISLLFFLSKTDIRKEIKDLHFFFQEEQIYKNLEIAINSDYNTNTIFLTRIFHNKISTSFDIFAVNTYRAIDTVFLFSFSSAMYDNFAKINFLYPFETVFFMISLIFLVKKWEKISISYGWIIWLTIFSLLVCGIFSPSFNYLKLMPFLITIRIINFVGLWELSKCFKKLS